jgi:hypothetical protein
MMIDVNFNMIENLLVTGFLTSVIAVHDDRNENWYVRNPAGNGVSFLSYKYL